MVGLMRLNYEFKSKTSSHIWRGIAKAWTEVNLGLWWQIGNGRQVRFWADSWIGELGPLKNLAFSDIPYNHLRRPICDFVYEQGRWQWNLFEDYLPLYTNLIIAACQPLTNSNEEAQCSWNLSTNGNFTVTSAYKLKEEDDWNEASNHCKSGTSYGNGREPKGSGRFYGSPTRTNCSLIAKGREDT